MATPPEDLKITYGGFAAGTGTEDTYTIIDNAYSIRYSRLTATVSFQVLVKGSSDTVTTSNVNALINAYRERRKQLTIVIKGSTVADFDPSGNINKDALPTIDELFDDHYTLTSRGFAVEVPLDMPPREANGRTEETVSLSEDSSRIQTVTVTVSYNSTTSGTALALMNADFDTYADSIRSFFSITTWELVEKPDVSTIPIINNQITVRAVYRELVFNQSSSGRDDADLVGFQLNIQVGKNFPGDFVPTQLPLGENSRKPKRLLDIGITVSTNVVKTVTDLVGKWENSIRLYAIQEAANRAGVQSYAVSSSTPSYDEVNRTINATLSMQGAVEGNGQVISSTLTNNINNDHGKLIIGAHDRTDFGKFEIQVKARRLRTIVENIVTIKGSTFLPAREPEKVGRGPRWVTINFDETVDPKTIGDSSRAGEFLETVEITRRKTQEWITDPRPGARISVQ